MEFFSKIGIFSLRGITKNALFEACGLTPATHSPTLSIKVVIVVGVVYASYKLSVVSPWGNVDYLEVAFLVFIT